MTLEELQNVGAAPTTLQLVSYDKAVPVSVILQMSKSEQSEFDAAIVVDNCTWAATARKTPIDRANVIYSGNAKGELGIHRRVDRKYFFKELSGNSLVTTKIIEISEETNMENGSIFDPSMFTQEVAASKPVAAPTAEATSFDENAGSKKQSGPTKTQQENQLISDIRKKSGAAPLANRMDCVYANRQYGRLIALITKNDSVTMPKVVVKKDKDKNVISKDIAFVNKNPGTVKGVIVATPEGSDVQLTKLSAANDMQADESKRTLKVHFLPTDIAYAYITANYDKRIHESEEVMGDKAAELFVDYKPYIKDGEEVVKATLKLANKDKRSSLVTEGNYYPLQAFKTISTLDMNEEEKAIANLNIKALLKGGTNNKGTTYAQLSDASKALVKEAGESVTSVWFNEGRAISVKRYDDKDSDVADIRVPVRVATETSTHKINYKYEYESQEVIVASPKYEKIVKATGLTPDLFVKRMKPFTSRKNSGRGQKDELSGDDILRMLKSGNVQINGVKGGYDDIIEAIAADAAIR